MAARFAPPPPPTIFRSGVRTPKPGVHSAPEYVVGTETSGRPLCAEASFAVSIAEPPPTARIPSTSAETSIRPDGTSSQRAACGSSSVRQRGLATRNGRSMPASASTPGSSASPKRTIMSGHPLACELDERARGASLGAAGGADEQDLALERQAFEARFGEGARVEVALDRGARDERHAVAGADGRRDRLLQAELDSHAQLAQPHPRATQLVLGELADAGAVLHHDQRLVGQLGERDGAASEAVARRAGEDDGVAEERLVLDAAVPRRRADDAQLERPVGDTLHD